jgi:hypothetical protein
MNHRSFPVVALVTALSLAGCGKAQEKAGEKALERTIESSIAKDGTQAKVDLSAGGMKVTTTDASGKTNQMELGNARISETDLGLPFYPGAKPLKGAAMRNVSGSTVYMQLGLHSDEAHDKVAAFYRDKLKAMSDGKQFTDMSHNDGASLSLVDDKARSTLQVTISKAEKGSDFTLVASREVAKP